MRDTEDTMFMGHKNMARKVTVGTPWGGPPFTCTNGYSTTEEECFDNGGNWVPVAPYPGTDTGNNFDWVNGTVDVSGYKQLYWIYGDWLSALPRAIYAAPVDATTGKPTVSYSCARCHTTGWTSDSLLQSNKEPEKSFPGITWDGTTTGASQDGKVNLAGGVSGDTNKRASWDVFGISCARCHNAAIDNEMLYCPTYTTQSTCEAANGIWNSGRSGAPSWCWNTLANCGAAVAGPPFGPPVGMSTHHNNLTIADNTSGACSDPRFTTEAACTSAVPAGVWMTNCSIASTAAKCIEAAATTSALCTGSSTPGTWFGAPGWCSNAFFTDQVSCTNNGSCADISFSTQSFCEGAGKLWTPNTWLDGWCNRTDLTTSSACASTKIDGPTINGLSRDGSVATLSFGATHTFTAGQIITITGAIPASFNGNFKVNPAPGSASLTYNDTGSAGSATYSGAKVSALGTLSWRVNGNQASCQVAGGSWSFSKCSVQGICNKGPAYTDAASCAAALGQWVFATDIIRCDDIHQYGKANGIPQYEAAHWTGSFPQRGGTITRLCMDCHRQETSGKPYDNLTNGIGSDSTTEPGNYIKVGPAHGTIAPVSHPAGNEFLNSPHGKFSGKFNEIATGTFNYGMTGKYKSYFMTEAEASNTGNGCTGCHEVHTSTVAGEEPFREECTECHAKDLGKMYHPMGTGTPLEEPGFEACVSCHMPEGLHLWRINSDPAYSTYPAEALKRVVNANAAIDGTWAKAVWADVDLACGQCHGGGLNQAFTTGRVDLKFWDLAADDGSNTSCGDVGGVWSGNDVTGKCGVVAASKTACEDLFGSWSTAASPNCTLTAGKYVRVPDATTGLAVGQKIVIKGAGALYYDEDGVSKLNDDFETYIVSLARFPWVTLAGAPAKQVNGVEVIQNETKNLAPYFDKANLAAKAKGIHNDKPVAAFSYSYDTNKLKIYVDAGQSSCNGSYANCDVFVWNWGDGNTEEFSGPFAEHTYATAGTKTVTLTVEQYGVNSGSVSKNINVYFTDLKPVVANDEACSILTANTWVANLTDASTDDLGVKKVTVNWGDGTAISTKTDLVGPPYTIAGQVFTHTYTKAGTFTVTQTAYDTKGQTSSLKCTVTTNYFKITGAVKKSDTVTAAPSVGIAVRKSGVLIKTVYTDVSGLYQALSLKPGTYTLTFTKSGYNFGAAPQCTKTVGANKVCNVTAVSP